ncbi:MAG TPA: hypothetical protein VGM34_04135 [Chlamydiales bacterium]
MSNSTALIPSILKPFAFNQVLGNSAQLIIEYLADSAVIDPGVQAIVASCLSNAWKAELEAEEFIVPWFKERIFEIADPSTQAFMNAVHVLFVDMAMAPLEKRFLQDLTGKLQARKEKIIIEREKQASLFVKALLGALAGQGSQAASIPLSTEGNCCLPQSKKALHKVRLCLEQDDGCLLQDSEGEIHLEPLSSRRILSHELIHIEQAVDGKAIQYLADVPKTLRWSNGLEMMAIRGSGKSANGSLLKESFGYYENSFARERGEMERISHYGLSSFGRAPKATQLAMALEAGINGTVKILLDEVLLRNSYRELVERVPSKKSSVDKLLAEKNYLDLEEVSVFELFEAWKSKGLKFTTDEEDRALQQQMLRGKQDAYLQLILALEMFGQKNKSAQLQGLVDAEERRLA